MAFVPKYILILFFLIITDYFFAKAIEKRMDKGRKIFLIASIITNVGTLFVFKYFNFFNINLAAITHFLDWNYSPTLISIALPLGLSFHVFQSLSYVIEVYRGKYPAEKNFLIYALYVMFFPQLVAGPIERPQHLLPQFKFVHQLDALKVRKGLERMLWGFFKKLVIADQLAIIVDGIYNRLPADGPTLVLLILFFTYQLYCDFSGYSDIAIGSALVLGFDLSNNFDRPFASKSITEFWRRWHISLSSWLRDYVYYPLALGWGKVSKARLYISMFITFVLIGLWHGANWTFVVMGALHGFYIVFASITDKARKKLRNWISLSRLPQIEKTIQVLSVFILVSVSFLFFRSKNVGEAWYILSHVGTNLTRLFDYQYVRYSLFRGTGLFSLTVAVALLSIVFMEIVQYYQSKHGTFYIFDIKPKKMRYSWYYALILIILFFGYFGGQTFIYFKF